MPDQNNAGDGSAQAGASGGTNNQGGTPESFDKFLEGQSDAIKQLYQQHTAGLQNTVKATRQERDDLAKQIKELSQKAEKGSELEKSLTDITGKLEQAERRAVFAEEAVKPEIGCRNPKAAYLLAVADNLFDRRGNPDWQALKAAAPELFGKPNPNANAGDGTQDPPNKSDMNSWIRRAAGRG